MLFLYWPLGNHNWRAVIIEREKEKFDCQIDYNHKNKAISNIAGEYIIVIA